jgi:hypothetical protein
MPVCAKNGANCYWSHCRRLPGFCSICGWQPPDACHPVRMLCATCFEESADAAFAANPKWKYPACSDPICRERSKCQAVFRGLTDQLRRAGDVVQACPPSLPPPCREPPPGLPASSSNAPMYCTASPSSAFTSTAGNISLAASVEGLQDDVLIMSRKAADIMVLLEQIKLTMSGNPRFEPLYQ